MRTAAEIIDAFPQHHPLLGAAAGQLLMNTVAATTGDYVEIGSAWGGSAIMAAIAMEGRPGTVYCIDAFAPTHELSGIDGTLLAFWANCLAFGVQERIVAFKQHHPPWPLPIWYHKFSVGFIDGAHDAPFPAQDWRGMSPRVTDYILMDNVERPAVKDVVESSGWTTTTAIEHSSAQRPDKPSTIALLRRP